MLSLTFADKTSIELDTAQLTGRNSAHYRQRVEKFLERQMFMHHIGFTLDVIEEGRTEGFLDLQEIHQQQKGFAHGGLIATLADITAGFAAYTVVPEDQHVMTAEIKVSYLNPGIGDKLHAVGWVLKPGRKIVFCESEVYAIKGDQRKIIAKATTSMAVISAEDVKKGNNATAGE
ncbi:PaaI family thioesterase [Roseivirga sp. BDSF3-8]|uniref:PaaI family thioesterase n=1 Tax=Roseivirga sp. BDSF3-8 TaxID=3241598 RepID=UPI003532021D